MVELKNYLINNFQKLRGSWIGQNNAYEPGLCQAIGFTLSDNRYWDAKWQDHYIELKKGKSIWLDLVRYGEQIVGINEDSKKEIITLFFIPNGDKSSIEKVIGVSKEALFNYLKIDLVESQSLLMIQKILPRSFNAQASATISDMEKISDFTVTRDSKISTTSQPLNETTVLSKGGDNKFIIDSRNKLNNNIYELSKKLISNVRQWYDGELKYNSGIKRYIESPDNFWTVDIQPRNQKLKIIVYGKPENYHSRILSLNINFRVYTEFFISSDIELQEGLRIIKEAAYNKGVI